MTFLLAYVNLPHGNDLTAQINNPALPFATMAAALLAGRPLAVPGQVRVDVVDQGNADPTKFAPPPGAA